MSGSMSGTAIALFSRTVNPIWPGLADIAVASMTPIPASAFANGATPTAPYQAEPGERIDDFKARITADLTAAGTLTGHAPGVLVWIYERGGFWERNAIGALLPVFDG